MIYPVCPKCGHAPLPANQALPAACTACGLVLAKFGAMPMRMLRDDDIEPVDGVPTGSYLARWLFHVPNKVARTYWYARAAALAAFALWTVSIFFGIDVRTGELGSSGFLHLVILPFHEEGHVFFRLFGEFVAILGGTLGQHLMPIVLGVALLVKRRDPFGAALFFWLLGYSVIDMAIYMYDAFDPQLMLLGGTTGAESDRHDWMNIFGDLGLMPNARRIGLFFGAVGRAMMCAGLTWAAYMVWLQKARLSDSPLAESDEDRKQRKTPDE